MIHLPWLAADSLEFPPPEQALPEPNGLLAAGGDLSPARLLEAYRQGIFPWYEEGQPILWWTPEPRTILRPGAVHISRSLRKVLRRREFTVTADECFAQVIAACAEPRDGVSGTWITPEMNQAYKDLHRLGHAHSIEVWRNGELVGGLYGVSIGQAFFGESMFSRCSNASKIALVHLAHQLEQWNFGVIDCQIESEHLLSMGAENVPRTVFQGLLRNYTGADSPAFPAPRSWTGLWDSDPANIPLVEASSD
ncbi:leucyl/phenylalanyl-tRNA--protein transferase [Gilvimarinus sp. F26214L]|uniref:leucyl/phenylalanyl-tRNA--protein transferase n=1 Tax=Gilvimarinus sp. DZF01 TaxID=3461371 RepID=UPI004045FBD0